MKKLAFVIALLCGVMLTGCTQLVQLSQQESDMLAEYMAGKVLEYSKDYEGTLVDLEFVDGNLMQKEIQIEDHIEDQKEDQKEDQIEDQIDVGDDQKIFNQEDNLVNQVELAQTIGKQDFSIEYTDFAICDSYPSSINNGYFTIEPSEDKQLFIAYFEVKNLSSKTKNFNLIGETIQYTLDINNGTRYQPLMTLLTKDLQYINLDIAAGASEKVEIVFEVLKKDSISYVNLIISNQNNSTVIKIK